MTGYTRPSTAQDVQLVADTMRQEDVAEVLAQSGFTPLQALMHCILHSKPCHSMISRHGHVMGMWGVVPVNEMSGRIWMLGTQGMVDDRQDRRQFLREARRILPQLHARYPVLFNHVDARNQIHIRWLRWMGFTFIQEHPNYGPEGRLFFEFCRMNHV